MVTMAYTPATAALLAGIRGLVPATSEEPAGVARVSRPDQALA